MKKALAVLLVLAMVFAACAALADTDKEIQFSGHTFGETLEQAAASGTLRNIQIGNVPFTPRVIADPLANQIAWVIYGSAPSVTFQTQWETYGPQQVAGLNAGAALYFYYPTKEDMAALNLKDGLFYAGAYAFYGDAKANYDELKDKLASIYGEPSAVGDGDAVFGPLQAAQSGSEEDIKRQLDEARSHYNALEMAAWKSSANNAMIVLVYSDHDSWQSTNLYYLDMDAEAKIMDLLSTSEDSGAGDTSGL